MPFYEKFLEYTMAIDLENLEETQNGKKLENLGKSKSFTLCTEVRRSKEAV